MNPESDYLELSLEYIYPIVGMNVLYWPENGGLDNDLKSEKYAAIITNVTPSADELVNVKDVNISNVRVNLAVFTGNGVIDRTEVIFFRDPNWKEGVASWTHIEDPVETFSIE
ncbi:MAG: hypothetical protein EP346_02270 [Bacteroidetes bacterium]|nr:MAG: hypothetical protein EP346_02270 [Bacteroidota bacterium]